MTLLTIAIISAGTLATYTFLSLIRIRQERIETEKKLRRAYARRRY